MGIDLNAPRVVRSRHMSASHPSGQLAPGGDWDNDQHESKQGDTIPEPIAAWIRTNRSWSNGYTSDGLPAITPEFVLGVYRIIERGYTDDRELITYAAESFPVLSRPLGLAFRPLDKSFQLLRKAGLITHNKAIRRWEPVRKWHRVAEPSRGLVHFESVDIMDAVTLCGLTDWIGSKDGDGETTDSAVNCRICESIVKEVLERRPPREARRP